MVHRLRVLGRELVRYDRRPGHVRRFVKEAQGRWTADRTTMPDGGKGAVPVPAQEGCAQTAACPHPERLRAHSEGTRPFPGRGRQRPARLVSCRLYACPTCRSPVTGRRFPVACSPAVRRQTEAPKQTRSSPWSPRLTDAPHHDGCIRRSWVMEEEQAAGDRQPVTGDR